MRVYPLVAVSLLIGCATALGCRARPSRREPTAERDAPSAATGAATPPHRGDDRWASVAAAIDAGPVPDVTVLVGTKDGVVWSHSRGAFSPERVARIASASKWVTAAALMTLVEQGKMSLDDHPQRWIPWWTSGASDWRSQITLEHLLSFRSGLPGSHPCLFLSRDIERCVKLIYEKAASSKHVPGDVFHYGGSHMQVAALMAMRASGESSWESVFRAVLGDRLGLSSRMKYDFPNAASPLAAAGISTDATTYGRFLGALLAHSIVPKSTEAMQKDRTGPPVTIEMSPIRDSISQEWHYGLGEWRECHSKSWEPRCNAQVVVSSPGAFGFYPWVDPAKGFWALVATEKRGGSDSDEDKDGGKELVYAPALRLGETIQPLIVAALATR